MVWQMNLALENKQYSDINQAFDKVWYSGLLIKLQNLVPQNLHNLLTSYLTERSFYVKHLSAQSAPLLIQYGAPQGTVLGPKLYLTYTSNIPTRTETVVATFANDTALLATSNSPTEASLYLQIHLNLLEKRRIHVNENKSQHIIFILRKRICPQCT